MQAEYREAVLSLLDKLGRLLGGRLVSAVVYGSVARGEARPDSDLDVLIVVDDLPQGPRARRALVAPAVDAAESLLQRTRPDGWISVVLKTPVEVERGGPLFYDMTLPGHVDVLHDPDRFMHGFLARLADRMAALGSVRRSTNGHPYWDLKPDWKPGDEIDL
jgi:predicted nucleotidyltransferase